MSGFLFADQFPGNRKGRASSTDGTHRAPSALLPPYGMRLTFPRIGMAQSAPHVLGYTEEILAEDPPDGFG